MNAVERLLIGDTNTEISVTDSDHRPKQLWQENLLGKALRHRGHDVRIPGLTGWSSFKQRSHNQIVYNTIDYFAHGSPINSDCGIALGTDATPVDPTQMSLIAGIQGATATAVISATTIAPYTCASGPYAGAYTPMDTRTLTATFVMTQAATLCEEGIGQSIANNPANGIVLARQTFTPIVVAINDIVTVTHTVIFSM